MRDHFVLPAQLQSAGLSWKKGYKTVVASKTSNLEKPAIYNPEAMKCGCYGARSMIRQIDRPH